MADGVRTAAYAEGMAILAARPMAGLGFAAEQIARAVAAEIAFDGNRFCGCPEARPVIEGKRG